MKTVSATTRFNLGLICLAISVWLLAFTLGMLPDRDGAVTDGRISLSENVALHCSLLASRDDRKTIKNSLRGLVERNRNVRSAAIRRPDGSLMVSVGPHSRYWDLLADSPSTKTQMRVPILAGETEWGTVEVRFAEPATSRAWGWLKHPVTVLLAFIVAATYLLYFFYLRKMLQHLDPSRVIPPRVRQTLDTLADGLLVLDKKERILLANQAFADCIGAQVSDLVGRKASELPWDKPEGGEPVGGYPWQQAMLEDTPQLGHLLTIVDTKKRRRILKVSAMPVSGEDGTQRGAMASFDDVTEIESSREQLRGMLDSLAKSRDETHRQNLELERLAAHDSLTDCLNRRAFFAELENHWSSAVRHDHPLACIMIDLDHFKLINDRHGHQKGDMVLEQTAAVLRNGCAANGIACRYGGEEFCVLLPYTELEAACVMAEELRAAIESADFDGLSVTSSLGVSARSLRARDPQEMIEQADQSLYVAKRDGRNQVMSFDVARDHIGDADESKPVVATADSGDEMETSIPFHAVTALLSALAYRDPATAEHSRRVADLCVDAARRLMPTSESYILEIAALLHDVGKIGVPDSILLKPGQLSEEEWKVMNSHERIGTEIVQSAFSNPKLTEIIRTYRAWFGGENNSRELPTGEEISVEARILAIADAYDAMTNRTAYREPLDRDAAFAELRRCKVRQFDPDLVERFIAEIGSRVGEEETQRVEVSKSAAFSFGTQIERLSEAMHSQDLEGISTLAKRLELTAIKYDSPEVAELAAELEVAAREEQGIEELVRLTHDLVELCRSAQRAYLDEAVSPVNPNL